MRHQFLFLLLCATFSFVVVDSQQALSPETFNNEKAIIFKANDGQKTDVFEGFIMAAENRNNAQPRKIRISYVRFSAVSTKKGSPIIYLAEGPDGSGIATAK
jgi:hypothetical protein